MQTHELEKKLKRLMLGRMLDTLDLRLEQAQKEKLGYLEFLDLLLEDEINRRANQALAQRVARARFEEVKTLSEFDFGYNPKIPATTIRDLATCGYLERKESVIICGPVGVGKSHISQALGHIACQRGYSVVYRKASKLLADLGGGHADGTFERRMRTYLGPDLLIIDDFGLRDFTPLQAEDFYELVCERYRSGSLMVVSNRTPKDWYALFPNPVLAEGALDRLINSSHYILMEGKSYRPLRRPDRGRAGSDPSSSSFPVDKEEVTTGS